MSKAKLLDPHTLRVVAQRFEALGTAFERNERSSPTDHAKGSFCLAHARILRAEATRKERGQRAATTRKAAKG